MSYADINRVVLVGRLTRDPELRALPSGSTVCGLRIACNGIRKDGDAYQERPSYFDVYVFGAHGENVERHLHETPPCDCCQRERRTPIAHLCGVEGIFSGARK
jgi:single-strand DNA-binding protein